MKNSAIIIGGVSGGIGSALAKRLIKSGNTVVGFARDQKRLDELQAEHPEIRTYRCDATDPEALKSCFDEIKSSFEQIDAYVHAIGSIFIKPAHLTSDEDWNQTLQTNLYSAFYALRAVTAHMNKQSSGSCLFFSTSAARAGIANHEAIAAAKGGIEAMVRSAAATYASRKIRVNAIAPSLTDTPLAGPMTQNSKMLEASRRMHPLNDIAQPDDVASLAEWLLSENAKFVTGQIFALDGGISSIVPKPKL
jgi:NAD(P)-dependent dehydrogenase (short-subunit alcohol dehydrogenase family)